MAEPHIVQCNLCKTKICTLIIFFKWICASAFLNHYAYRWESSLPPRKRSTQRKKRKKIRTYQWITFLLVLFNFIVTTSYYGFESIKTRITVIASLAYLFTFWYVIQGQEEFKILSHAWHSGKARELYSRIWMTEQVKVIVVVVSIAELAASCLIKVQIAWYIVTLLQFASCYVFLDPNIRRLFPRDENGNNVLVYKIDRILL